MNLCEDLQILSRGVATVQTSREWTDLLNFLTQVITNDLYMDYAKPSAAALLAQCAVGGAQVTSQVDQSTDASKLTCTLTLS
jgi:hypothetical protein